MGRTRLRIRGNELPLVRRVPAADLVAWSPLARCSQLEKHATHRFENHDESLVLFDELGGALDEPHGATGPGTSPDISGWLSFGSLCAFPWSIVRNSKCCPGHMTGTEKQPSGIGHN